MSNRDRFLAVYRKKLAEAVAEHPDQYVWPIEELDPVMARMTAALDRRSYNKDSTAIRNTCRVLRIKHTYTAINEFISEGGQS